MKVKFNSEMTCPECGNKVIEAMPEDACWYFYECKRCSARLKPLPGNCCVFCSYGTVACPPVQKARNAVDSPGCYQ